MFRTLTALILLLIVPVWTEWVEISQQHYRKPIRTHSAFTTPAKAIFVEESTKPTYINHSFIEHNWNKSPAKSPGNVRRVEFFTTIKTTESTKIEEDEYPELEVIDYEIPNKEIKKPFKVKENSKPKGTVERVPNIGNVKRVQLNTTPVMSPTVKTKGERNPNYNEHSTTIRSVVYKNNPGKIQQRFEVNKAQKPLVTEKPLPIIEDDISEEAAPSSIKNSMQTRKNYTSFLKNFHTAKPTFVTEIENDFPETLGNRFYKINKFSEEPNASYVPKSNKKPEVINFETESQENRVTHLEDEKKHTNNKPKQDPKLETRKEGSLNKKQDVPNRMNGVDNKVHTMENLVKFMRVVADTISRNSRRTFGGKMHYLHELKETIWSNIEERIDATWPDDDATPGPHRRSRAAEASPRGHVQFPSSESALMTISFLTFAVFLIKLVLQVIQTYKHKTMMVAPLMVSSGRNAFKRGRN